MAKSTILILLVIFFTATGFKRSTTLQTTGSDLYKKNCSRCHGADGTKGFLGAKNLQKSILSDSAVVLQIQRGKGFMPSFKKKFSPQELNQIVLYIKDLRTNKKNI